MSDSETHLPQIPTPANVGSLEIEVVVSPPFMENTWLLHHGDGTACALVDPGFQPGRIIDHLKRRKLTPKIILLTHGHADHIAGNRGLRQEYPQLPIVIGVGDALMLSDPVANLSGLGGIAVTSPPADRLLRDGDRITAIGLDFEVRDLPGHSPGHIVYILHGDPGPFVIGGDVLFQGAVGRFDFPGGDRDLLFQGIRTKLFVLPDQTTVFPGHGDPTTIGEERRNNPFVGENAGLFEIE